MNGESPIPRPAPRPTPGRARLALGIALAADLLQLAVFPAFASGLASPLADALDVVVAVALVTLLGWHAALLPTLVVELLPVADLFPTWTAAVAYVLWRARRKP